MARALNHILQKRYLTTHIPSTLYCFSIVPSIKHNACYSTKKSVTKIDSNETNNQVQIGTAEVGKFHTIYIACYCYKMVTSVPLSFSVKENLKSAGYLGVIIGGIGVTALILYALFSELFSSKSPYAVYSEARVRCIEHPKVMDILGAPVKAYGEETRRGRRRHITYVQIIFLQHLYIRY